LDFNNLIWKIKKEKEEKMNWSQFYLEKNNLPALLGSPLVLNRMQEAVKLTKKTKKETGFAIWISEDLSLIGINKVLVGNESSFILHTLTHYHPYLQGYFTPEGCQIVATFHTHPHFEKLLSKPKPKYHYPSSTDIIHLWENLESNYRLAARNSDYTVYINPLIIVIAVGESKESQEIRGSATQFHINPCDAKNFDYIPNIGVELDNVFMISLLAYRIEGAVSTYKAVQHRIKKENINIRLFLKEFALENLGKIAKRFQSFIPLPPSPLERQNE